MTAVRKKLGVTPERFGEMLASQRGLCDLCFDPLGNRPQMDHDHDTGKVRGILCTQCNVGLGMFKDDPDRLRLAIEYLEYWEDVVWFP